MFYLESPFLNTSQMYNQPCLIRRNYWNVYVTVFTVRILKLMEKFFGDISPEPSSWSIARMERKFCTNWKRSAWLSRHSLKCEWTMLYRFSATTYSALLTYLWRRTAYWSVCNSLVCTDDGSTCWYFMNCASPRNIKIYHNSVHLHFLKGTREYFVKMTVVNGTRIPSFQLVVLSL